MRQAKLVNQETELCFYRNRKEAGQNLGTALRKYSGPKTIVLALPRGGVVLGYEVSKVLRVPMSVLLVKKIGHPLYPEYAIAAVAKNGPIIYSQSDRHLLDSRWLKKAELTARRVLDERHKLYFGKDLAMPALGGRTVILVDDGIATGLTMQVAILTIRQKKASKVVVAVPVASAESIALIEKQADEVIVLSKPEMFFGSVGAHYRKFEQVEDETVKSLLKKEGQK